MDEYNYYNGDICDVSDVRCSNCCREGGCTGWQACNATFVMGLVAICFVSCLFFITFCCLYRGKKKKAELLIEKGGPLGRCYPK